MVQIAFNGTLFVESVVTVFSHSDTDALLWGYIRKVTCLLPSLVSGQRGFGSLIFIDKVITAPED